MRVKELIEKLQAFDGDMDVGIEYEDDMKWAEGKIDFLENFSLRVKYYLDNSLRSEIDTPSLFLAISLLDE